MPEKRVLGGNTNYTVDFNGTSGIAIGPYSIDYYTASGNAMYYFATGELGDDSEYTIATQEWVADSGIIPQILKFID